MDLQHCLEPEMISTCRLPRAGRIVSALAVLSSGWRADSGVPGAVRCELLVKTRLAFDGNGIPFPQRDVHMYKTA